MKPFYAQGTVIKGFGRGSKELGIPTANFAEKVVEGLPPDVATGVYYGWAKVDEGPVFKMVMSIGWNPYYKNEKKSMETHILHQFDSDFYGSWLRVIVCGYRRPEKNYKSLDDLISDIKEDIADAKEKLDDAVLNELKGDYFFSKSLADCQNSPALDAER